MATLSPYQIGLPQSWLPDETLFSICSRYHRASCNARASETCRTLFGHNSQGGAHDIPARLHYFTATAGPHLGCAREIMESHSVLGLYLRFASPAVLQTTVDAAAGNSSGQLKFQLRLLTGQAVQAHPLKACAACIEKDQSEHFAPYWHLEHQLPGVWVCRRHGCALQVSRFRAQGAMKAEWRLPSSPQLFPPVDLGMSAGTSRIAAMVADASRSGSAIPVESASRAFRLALAESGLLPASGQQTLRNEAGVQYSAFVGSLFALDQGCGLPRTTGEAYIEIQRLISHVTKAMHPVRRLALAAWLFKDFTELQACTDRSSSLAVAEGVDEAETATSRARGIWTGTDFVPDDVRRRLSSLLTLGVPKDAAAKALNVASRAVAAVLNAEPGLHDRWRLAGFENVRRRNRRRWQRALASNPLSGVRAARLAEPSAYMWLYRHDLDWLLLNSSSAATANAAAPGSSGWDDGDIRLAEEVRKAALLLIEVDRLPRVKLIHLFDRVPALKARMTCLDRFPLTRKAVYSVVGQVSRS